MEQDPLGGCRAGGMAVRDVIRLAREWVWVWVWGFAAAPGPAGEWVVGFGLDRGRLGQGRGRIARFQVGDRAAGQRILPARPDAVRKIEDMSGSF